MADIQHVVTGAGLPTEIPPSVGAHYIDVTRGAHYLANGTESVDDWMLVSVGDGLMVGDVLYSVRNPGEAYLIADGSALDGAEYPALAELLPSSLWMSISDFWEVDGVATDSAGTWIVSTGSGLLRSDDDGETWSQIEGVDGWPVRSIATDGHGVWVFSYENGQGRRSTDNGVSWSMLTISTPARAAWLATDGAGNWVAAGDSTRISSDNGATWVGSEQGGYSVVYGAGTWVMATSSALYRSTDNGISWSNVAVFNGTALATDGAGTWVGCGSGGEAVRSVDNGMTWSPINPMAGGPSYFSVVFVDDAFVISGGYGTPFATRSFDGGATWIDDAGFPGGLGPVAAASATGVVIGARMNMGDAVRFGADSARLILPDLAASGPVVPYIKVR